MPAPVPRSPHRRPAALLPGAVVPGCSRPDRVTRGCQGCSAAVSRGNNLDLFFRDAETEMQTIQRKDQEAGSGPLGDWLDSSSHTPIGPALAGHMHTRNGESNLRLCGGVKFMSERLLAKGLAFAIFLGGAASLAFGQPADDPAASVYKTNCVSCHGADGRGSVVGKSLHAADFHSAQVQQQTDAQLATVISEGRGNMPAFGTRLSKDQIDALVKYIRSMGKSQ